MPIVDIEMVADHDPNPDLAGVLADRIGHVLQAPEGSTWIRLRSLPRANYAESGGPVPSDVKPVFVGITAYRRPDRDRMIRISEDIASAIAEATGRSKDNVHVSFDPDAAGRIAFGGRLVE